MTRTESAGGTRDSDEQQTRCEGYVTMGSVGPGSVGQRSGRQGSGRPKAALFVVAMLAVALQLVTTGLLVGSAQATPKAARCAGNGPVIVVNGTNDDPPPDTDPAKARYQRQGYRGITLDYPATVWPLGAQTYDDNVRLAVPRLAEMIRVQTARCPDQPIALVGFSQGSRIIGDVVSAIGNARPVALPGGRTRVLDVPKHIRVELFADPRRDAVPGRPGAGVETLFPGMQVYPGLTMTGSRPGGFGTLRERVVEVCIVGDPICDSVRPPDWALMPTLVDGLVRFSLRHTRYGPDPGRPMARDPWRHAVGGTWIAPPPRLW